MTINFHNMDNREASFKRLSYASEVLKSEFVGLDDTIDRLLSLVSAWYVTPEVITRPVVISLWGMTGTGKSSVVRRLIELLDLSPRTITFDCGLEANDSSSSSIADKVSDNFSSDECDFNLSDLTRDLVFVFDEFQYARTIDEHGCELIKSSLRPIWNIIDNGKLNISEYRYEINYYLNFLDDLSLFVAENPGIVVKSLRIEDEVGISLVKKSPLGFFYFNSSDLISQSSSNTKGGDSDPLEIVNDRILRTVYRRLNSYRPGLGRETLDRLIACTSLEEIVSIMRESKPAIISPKVLDCSKSLVFILGNLDEAFKVGNEINPDEDADVFYDITSKVTVSDIKEALKLRFRPEQIARLGNNLIKYPTIKRSDFVKIIRNEVDRVLNDFSSINGIKVTLSSEMYDLLYSEGVYPVQGVRPVFTTIGVLLTPFLSDIIIGSKNIYKDVHIRIHDISGWRSNMVKLAEVDIDLVFSDDYIITKTMSLQLGELRDPTRRKTRYINSVHEIGHAIVMAYLTGELPINIVSVSSGNGGFCTSYISNKENEISCKEDIDNDVMISLAGYESERLIFGPDNKKCLLGSGSDLERAWETFSDAVYKLGYFSPMLYSNYSTSNTPDGIPPGIDSLSKGAVCNTVVRSKGEVDLNLSPYDLESLLLRRYRELNERTAAILSEERRLIVKASLYLGEEGSMRSDKFLEFIEKYGNKLTVDHLNNTKKCNDSGWYVDQLQRLDDELNIIK